MKPGILTILSCSLLLSASLFAGPPDYKQVAPAPSPCDYGTGWYVALHGGANVYQDVNRNRDHIFANGDVLEFSSDSNVGGYGGVKIGYVFGKETFRFAL